MNSLCLHLQRSHSYPVELNDLRGEGIVRAKIYLEKLAGIDFTLINGEWSELIAFNKLRNCIVHSEGNIKASKNSTQLENIINQKSSLSLRHERHLKVEREYIDAIMTTTEAFLEKLHQQAIPA